VRRSPTGYDGHLQRGLKIEVREKVMAWAILRMRVHPFALGQVASAIVVGTLTAAFFNLTAVVLFCAILALGAGASAVICRWCPGFDAAGWKLWLTGTLSNPVTLCAVIYSARKYECLVGQRTGWDCMLVEIGPVLAGIGCVPPLAGIVVRWWARRHHRKV
jgi:hypothetical protein